MKKVFILLMLFVTIPVFSQVRLGSPIDSIRKEFSDLKYNAQSGTIKKEEVYFSINTPIARVIYFFDSRDLCYVVQLIPKNKEYFDYYRDNYNKYFKKISKVQWRADIDKVSADIVLTYPDSTKYSSQIGYDPFFTWTYLQNK